jgi:hypothetical protein
MTVTVLGDEWTVHVDHAGVFRGQQRLERTVTYGG